MEKGKEHMRYLIVFGVLVLFLVNLPSVSSAVIGGKILDSNNNTIDMYYSIAAKAYTDGVGGNPDTKLRIYGTNAADVANRYVAAVYAVNTSGSNPTYSVITADPVGAALAQTGASFACPAGYPAGSLCADTDETLIDFQTNKPATGDAAAFFPGNVNVFVSDDDNIVFGGTDEMAPVYSGVSSTVSTRNTQNGGNGTLRGSYTLNANVESLYVPATGMVSIQVTGASATTTGAAANPETDHPGEPFILIGVCDDIYGLSCNSALKGNLSMNSESFYTGVVSPPDSITTTKYAVINGLGRSFCIGPNIYVSSVVVGPPNSGFPGAHFNITATVINGGNVDVTQNFNLSFYDHWSVLLGKVQINGGLAVGASKQAKVELDTTGYTEGTYNVQVDSDHVAEGIADCVTSTGNSGTSQVYIIKAYILTTYINGVETTTFPSPGRLYNITMQLNDTDGNPVNDAILRITEVNGISLFAPMQIFNETPGTDGLKPTSIAETTTNTTGGVSYVLAPTGNILYNPPYSYTDIENYHGNYSLYVEAYKPANTKLDLVTPSLQYFAGGAIPFNFTNESIQYPNATEIDSEQYVHQDNFVQQIYDVANQLFAAAFRRMDLI